jgi:(R)-2-hydroxyacyl-CoA dehydratese activating ATPase
MTYYVGIDIGSATTKVAVVNDHEILGARVTATGVNCEETSRQSLDIVLNELHIERSAVKRVVTTGYGRRLIKFADSTISEISANVKGSIWYGVQAGKTVRTIINIGGQDSKVISVDDKGVTRNFNMNDKCAAGTGRYLENLARILEVNLDELGDLSLQSTIPIRINSTCTVFAESEVVSLIARQKDKADIIAGAHVAIAQRIGKMIKRTGVVEIVFFDGGPALNRGLVKALEDELAVNIYVPPRVPQVTTAVGAALIARDGDKDATQAGLAPEIKAEAAACRR